ncbi:MAG: glycosyltransferase family 39 protein, partial [Acidobacteriota bacterium]|nr:glycosyltransferase family 39 protein [Acidobacteriota bacterium]
MTYPGAASRGNLAGVRLRPIDAAPASAPFAAVERRLAWGLLVFALLLRLFAIFRYRFDSDEAQHLHVAWGWTRGLLQYRDLFDNHTPLFHIISAPLVAALGETPRILYWMRLAMLPLYAVTLAATYLLGNRLFSPRAALWGTVFAALLPPFYWKTLEYRTDDLWAALWVLALLVLLTARLGPGRALAGGLLLGALLAVSLKSVLLLVTLAAATAASYAFLPARRQPGGTDAGRPAPG